MIFIDVIKYLASIFKKKKSPAAAGWKVYTYTAGTTQLNTTYYNSSLTIPNTNPVILDVNGRADIWLEELTDLVWVDKQGNAAIAITEVMKIKAPNIKIVELSSPSIFFFYDI